MSNKQLKSANFSVKDRTGWSLNGGDLTVYNDVGEAFLFEGHVGPDESQERDKLVTALTLAGVQAGMRAQHAAKDAIEAVDLVFPLDKAEK